MKIINKLLRKLGLIAIKIPMPLTDEMRINLYAEHISKTPLKHEFDSRSFDPLPNPYAGEVNWDTWQARINDKILEKDLKSDKEHLGDL